MRRRNLQMVDGDIDHLCCNISGTWSMIRTLAGLIYIDQRDIACSELDSAGLEVNAGR
jgi:hypothetical protein